MNLSCTKCGRKVYLHQLQCTTHRNRRQQRVQNHPQPIYSLDISSNPISTSVRGAFETWTASTARLRLPSGTENQPQGTLIQRKGRTSVGLSLYHTSHLDSLFDDERLLPIAIYISVPAEIIKYKSSQVLSHH